MIYTWIGAIIDLCKDIRHFFRKLVCEDYYIEAHGIEMCGRYTTEFLCDYCWCPKRIGEDNE